MNLDNTFGMFEMEKAALILVRRANKLKIPMIRVRLNVCRRLSRMERVGVCQLAVRGWIRPDYPNNEFCPTQTMIDRIKNKHPACLRYE
jgi:hypothetical protein